MRRERRPLSAAGKENDSAIFGRCYRIAVRSRVWEDIEWARPGEASKIATLLATQTKIFFLVVDSGPPKVGGSFGRPSLSVTSAASGG